MRERDSERESESEREKSNHIPIVLSFPQNVHKYMELKMLLNRKRII